MANNFAWKITKYLLLWEKKFSLFLKSKNSSTNLKGRSIDILAVPGGVKNMLFTKNYL